MKSEILVIISLSIMAISVRGSQLINFGSFITGVFAQYNLLPTQILLCWNESTSGTFLNGFNLLQNYSQSLFQANNSQAEFYYSNIVASINSLSYAFNCSQKTFEFKQFMNSIRVPIPSNWNSDFFVENLYFETYPDSWNAQMQPVLQLIASGNYLQAGAAFVPVFGEALKQAENIFQTSGNMKSFYNGMFYAAGITLPSQAYSCYNASMANVQADFFTDWASTIGSTSVSQVASANSYFFGTSAQELKIMLAPQVYNCLTTSQDYMRFTQAVGINLVSSEFNSSIFYVASQNPSYYQQMMLSISDLMNDGNYFVAGQKFFTYANYTANSQSL